MIGGRGREGRGKGNTSHLGGLCTIEGIEV